jgi:hypothetical protein
MSWGILETCPLPVVHCLMGDICPNHKTECAPGSYVVRYPKHAARSDMIPRKSSALFSSSSEDQKMSGPEIQNMRNLWGSPSCAHVTALTGTSARSDASSYLCSLIVHLLTFIHLVKITSTYLLLLECLYSPCGPSPLFQFPDLFSTIGRTPWMSDQLIARPLPKLWTGIGR